MSFRKCGFFFWGMFHENLVATVTEDPGLSLEVISAGGSVESLPCALRALMLPRSTSFWLS
eukprot:10722357-Heterocapsa_arctica.AAC.1